MTREEAIEQLNNVRDLISEEAIDMAIEALQAKTAGDLISRQDAVNEIHKYFVEEIDKTPVAKDEDGDEVYTDMPTVNALLKRNKELSKRIKSLPSAEPKTGWIPVTDRLPDDKTYVLTTIQVNGRQPHARSGFYHGGFFHNDNGDTWRATERPVKAWMPLPEPYKGGDEE